MKADRKQQAAVLLLLLLLLLTAALTVAVSPGVFGHPAALRRPFAVFAGLCGGPSPLRVWHRLGRSSICFGLVRGRSQALLLLLLQRTTSCY